MKGDSQLWNNIFITTPHDSPPSPRNSTITCGFYVGHLLPQPVLSISHHTSQAARLFFEPFTALQISQPQSIHTYSPMNMEQTECSKTLTFKVQLPRNNPEENIWHLLLIVILHIVSVFALDLASFAMSSGEEQVIIYICPPTNCVSLCNT
jgi:hypothetical protein